MLSTCDHAGIRREDGHKKLLNQVEVWGGAAKGTPRIFCGIYTYHKNHQTKVKVRCVLETCAPRVGRSPVPSLGVCVGVCVSMVEAGGALECPCRPG